MGFRESMAAANAEREAKEAAVAAALAEGKSPKEARQAGKEVVRGMRRAEKAARDAKYQKAKAERKAKAQERRAAVQAVRDQEEMADPRFVQWDGAKLVLQGPRVFEVKHQSAMSGGYIGYAGVGAGSMEMVDQAHPLNGRRVVIPADQIVGVGMLAGDLRRLPVVQVHLADGREYQFVGRDVASAIERQIDQRGRTG